MGTPAAQIEAQDFRHHHVESAQKAMAAGVRVAAATDAGGWVHGNNAQDVKGGEKLYQQGGAKLCH